MFYNEYTKKRYIEYREDKGKSGSLARNTFIKAKSFEEELGKDVYDFTIFEIKNMYKSINIRSISSLRNVNSVLKQYTGWAIQENMVADQQNHFEEMKTSDYTDCINQTAVNKRLLIREQVLSYCQQLSEPSDKFLFLACFEGIAGKDYEELTSLKLQDFDLDKCKVKLCTGRTIDVSRQLCAYAIQSAETFTYTAQNGMGKEVPLTGDDLIIKDFTQSSSNPSVYRKGRRIYFRFTRLFDFLRIGDWMTINALVDSGYVAWIAERQVSGINPKEYIVPCGSAWAIKDFKNQFGRTVNTNWYEKCSGYFE